MVNFVRTLCITIASGLFSFVPKLYKLFYDLAGNHNLFSSETLQTFSRNIYVLISVVMLFAFAVKAIESIINPDLLFDSKKGFTSVIKRSAIALVLIILVPYGFTLFYQVQDEVMSKSLIEKIILGVNVDNSQNTSDNQNTENNKNNIADSTGAAQMLASVALQSVLHPEGDTCTEYEDTNVCSEYSTVINEDVGKIFHLIDNINEKVENSEGEQDYVLEYEWNGLLSVIVGGVLIYFLAIFCLDTALRLIKMAFLELTAPISIIAYIYAGNDTLKKWWKEVLGTAMSLFGRIAALAFMIFVLSKLPEFTANNFGGAIYTNIVNLLIIIATLIFIREAPDMIDRLFGIKVGGKGGIAGRLGKMAGVGDAAKGAWEKMRNVGGTVLGTGAAIGAGAAAIAFNPLAGAAIAGAGIGGKAVVNRLRNTEKGEKIATTGKALGAMAKEKNPISGVKAYKKAMDESAYGVVKSQEKAAKTVSKINSSIDGMDENGKVLDSVKANNSYANAVKKSNAVPSSAEGELVNRHAANFQNGLVKGVKDKSDKISEQIETAKKYSNNDVKSRLDQLDYNRRNNIISSSEFAQEIKKLKGATGSGINDGIIKEIDKNINGMNNLAIKAGINDVIFDKEGKLNMGALNAEVTSAQKAADSAEGNYKAMLDKVTDPDRKLAIETYASNSDTIIEKSVKDIAKGATVGASSPSSTTATTSTTSGTSTTTTSGTTSSNQNTQSSNSSNMNINNVSSSTSNDIPTGYTQTDSGIIVPNDTTSQTTRTNNTTSTSGNVDTNAYGEYVNYNDSRTRNTSNNNSTSDSSSMNSTGQSSTGYEIPADGGGYSGGTNNSNPQSGSNSTIVNNTTNNTTSTEQDLSSFFSNLSNDIKNANRETNNILNDQLKSQQSILDESKKQSKSLDNINSGVDSIKGSVDELGNRMDSYGTSINKNIDDLNKKIDDNDNNE